MSNPHQELASPDQTISGKDSSNPLRDDNLPKIIWYSTHHIALTKSWLVQKQMTIEGIDCLPNEEIFTELSRMSLVRNMDSSTKFYMYPCFLQLMIKAQVGDLSLHTTKYSSPALTQKVFANMRRVGKGFSKEETPLFEGMIVAQEVGKGVVDVNVKDVSAAEDCSSSGNQKAETKGKEVGDKEQAKSVQAEEIEKG
nr:hypothetical protein [Tanacetum cinerariifolium]